MKTKLFIAIAFVFLFSSCEYNPGVSEAFTKYRFKEGVTAITVPGWVINMAANFAELEDYERDLLESIDKVRILAVENDDLNARINLHDEFNEKINRNHDFEELMTVRSDDEQVTIFGNINNDVISEMVVLVGGSENALVYIRGEIDPDLINRTVNLSDSHNLLTFLR